MNQYYIIITNKNSWPRSVYYVVSCKYLHIIYFTKIISYISTPVPTIIVLYYGGLVINNNILCIVIHNMEPDCKLHPL